MRGLLIVFAVLIAQMGHAQSYEGCTKVEAAAANAAIAVAKRMALNAAAAVDDTPTYERWFGRYNKTHGEMVRANLKSIVSATRSGRIVGVCEEVGRDGCDPDSFAFVYSDEPLRIHLCPPFFRMPTLVHLRPDTSTGDNGSKSGTIIHELSHFDIIAKTEDICYSRSECDDMARRSPRNAVMNADSYQYFSEDVALALRDAVE